MKHDTIHNVINRKAVKWILLTAILISLTGIIYNCIKIDVKADNTIWPGISIGGINISGMTVDEANAAVNSYIAGISGENVTFVVADGNKVTTTYGDLGIYWANSDIISNSFADALKGNVIERYKAKKDIEISGLSLELDVAFDNSMVEMFINSECKKYDASVANASITRENGEFVITGGEPGEAVSLSGALALISDELYSDYVNGVTEVTLPLTTSDLSATLEQLSQVNDLLGTYTTSFSTSGTNRANNVINGCSKLNGIVLLPGEELSAYQTISPFTQDNGYYLAGSYSNGQVVESFGGGICQVTSTLYNAVLLAELDVTERNNHSMVVTYVPKSADAAIAESSGKDFKFVNSTEYPIYIEGITQDKKITFNIYGVETRPENRKVEYVSEVLSETVPEDMIIADSSRGIGSFSTESAHIGYTARLWKVVYEDGEEVSRDIVNNSRYAPSSKRIYVGVATDNPDYYNRMMAAIATGDSGVCQVMAAQIQAEQQQINNAIVQQQQQDAAVSQ